MPFLPPLCILLVDRDAAFIHILGLLLRDRGYMVLSATDGKSALRLVDEADMVLVNTVTQGIQGTAAISPLLQRKVDLKVLACGTSRNEEFLEELGQLGVENFLEKPFPIGSLVKEIELLRHRVAA